MCNVTTRIKSIKQPRGGYIKPSEFEIIDLNDGKQLNSDENVHANIIGMTVDYLTRIVNGANPVEVFNTPLEGAVLAETLGNKNSIKAATKLLKHIKGLDKKSIINACKLVTFSVWAFNPEEAAFAKSYKEIKPDESTIFNIQVLIERSIEFFKKFGSITKSGFTFEPPKADMKAYEKMLKTGKGTYGGYTPTVTNGDGDFLTKDTLWDFKVTKSPPTNKHTLQLLMYWIMGQHSGQNIFKDITKIGIFNPRLNKVYILDIDNIPDETIKAVEKDVICY